MKKRIVFMGTPNFSANILEKLSQKHEVVLVLTQEDKAVGRKQILTASPVKLLAKQIGLDLAEPKTLKNNLEVFNLIKEKNPDFIIVAAYGKILPKEILEICPCINTHASILPKYRGSSPIQTSILNADKVSGVTLMLMDEGLDTGDILYQENLNIDGLNSIEVFSKMSDLSAKMLDLFLDEPNKYKRIKQDETKATKTKMIKKIDGCVEFIDARNVYQKYLAYYEWPGIYLENGLKLLELEINEEESLNKAGVIEKIDKNSLVVTCSKGSLRLFYVQAPGKKRLDIISYINGKRLKVGDCFV